MPRPVTEDGQPLRRVDRQLSQDQRVENRENGRVRADAQRKREDRHARHEWRRAQHAPSVADVLHQTLERGPTPEGPGVLANQHDVAEVAPRGESSVLCRQTGRCLFVRFLLEVERDLFVEVGLLAAELPQSAKASVDLSKSQRRSYSARRRTRVIASESCSHFDCSDTSCFRPARVSW